VGDALGWPVEFMSFSEIRAKYGDMGIDRLDMGIGTKAEISDDTQMTIFTADGLLRSMASTRGKGIPDCTGQVYMSYLRWLITQGETLPANYQSSRDIRNGWLMEVKGLYHRRAPGNTCITALRSGIMGTMEDHINNSKGCGGIMRAAPVGLVTGRDRSFIAGAQVAAITHGNPTGYLAAGALSYMIRSIIDGSDIEEAVEGTIAELMKYDGSQECINAVLKAVKLASEGEPDTAKVSTLGEGWVAEETLSIAIYCSLVCGDDFRKAVLLAVNHNGDSDSTGAVIGNILGAYLGIDAIPEVWSYGIELSAELRELAGDLRKLFRDHDIWRYKYPIEER
jgi:ADP-ribosylglycohydrolase